jgi:hydrogenase maturation protein HypF
MSKLQLHPPPNPLPSREGETTIDFSRTIAAILADQSAGVSNPVIARRFHNTVAEAAARMCLKIAADTGLDRVVLSGGVFQNRLLSELVYNLLSSNKLQVFTHRLVPPNDGGIALGQAAIAGRRIN